MFGLNFESTINLGNVISLAALVLTIIITYTKARSWLEGQLTEFKITLRFHEDRLEAGAQRMDRHEAQFTRITEQLQRLIGRLDRNFRDPRNNS